MKSFASCGKVCTIACGCRTSHCCRSDEGSLTVLVLLLAQVTLTVLVLVKQVCVLCMLVCVLCVCVHMCVCMHINVCFL